MIRSDLDKMIRLLYHVGSSIERPLTNEDEDEDEDEDKDQEDQPSAGTSYGPNLTASPSCIKITPHKFQSAEFDMLPMQLFNLNLKMIAEESENGD